jgi:uncharacterized 2Fe-2S/4Fe-4S cluster protein (DUF4445 family)
LDTLREGAQRVVEFAPCSSVGEAVDGACFAAFDLGTTSIVCYLLDGRTGEEIVSRGMQNPQSAYGADVISRANYVLTSNEPDALCDCVIAAFQTLIEQTTKEAGRTPEQVTLVSIVGNTVMHHILLGLPLEQLVRAPYTPGALESQIWAAADINLRVHPQAVALIGPVIGGFVGADTVACLTATSFEQITQPTLLLDIGTNGELVCTNGVRRASCSNRGRPSVRRCDDLLRHARGERRHRSCLASGWSVLLFYNRAITRAWHLRQWFDRAGRASVAQRHYR